MSTYVKFESVYRPCNFLVRAWSCRLKILAAWLCFLTHPCSSRLDASVPNLATFWAKHPRGPVLCIQKFLAPWSYNAYNQTQRIHVLKCLLKVPIKIIKCVFQYRGIPWENMGTSKMKNILRLVKCSRSWPLFQFQILSRLWELRQVLDPKF